MSQEKTYEVELFRFPEMVTVKARSKAEAKELAKKQADFVVWDSKVL